MTFEQQIEFLMRKNPFYKKYFVQLSKKQKISFVDVERIFKKITEFSDILKSVSFNISVFDNLESLEDFIVSSIEQHQKKSFTHSFISKKYSHLMDDDVYENFFTLKQMNISRKTIQDQFINKIAAFKDKETFKQQLSLFVDKITNHNIIDIRDKAKKLSASILLEDHERGLLAIEVFDFKTSNILGSSSWCISYGESYFESYTDIKNFGDLLSDNHNRLVFIYDFSKPSSSPYSLIGVTYGLNYETVEHIYDKNDSDCKSKMSHFALNIKDEFSPCDKSFLSSKFQTFLKNFTIKKESHEYKLNFLEYVYNKNPLFFANLNPDSRLSLNHFLEKAQVPIDKKFKSMAKMSPRFALEFLSKLPANLAREEGTLILKYIQDYNIIKTFKDFAIIFNFCRNNANNIGNNKANLIFYFLSFNFNNKTELKLQIINFFKEKEYFSFVDNYLKNKGLHFLSDVVSLERNSHVYMDNIIEFVNEKRIPFSMVMFNSYLLLKCFNNDYNSLLKQVFQIKDKEKLYYSGNGLIYSCELFLRKNDLSVIELILNYKNNIELQIEFLDELIEHPKHFFELLTFLNNKNPEFKKSLISHYSNFIKDSLKKFNLQHMELFKFIIDNNIFIQELSFQHFKLLFERNIISVPKLMSFIKKTNDDDETSFLIELFKNNEIDLTNLKIELLFKNKKTFTLIKEYLDAKQLNLNDSPFTFNNKVLKSKYFDILK